MMEVLQEGLISAGIIPTEVVSLESGLETAALNPGLHGSGKEPQIRSTVRIAKVGPPLSAACGAHSDLTLSVDRAQIVTEQRRDSSLARCRATVISHILSSWKWMPVRRVLVRSYYKRIRALLTTPCAIIQRSF
ncbi:hypothetical protein SRHO_G00227990 [Serrasalmus rhombeus]